MPPDHADDRHETGDVQDFAAAASGERVARSGFVSEPIPQPFYVSLAAQNRTRPTWPKWTKPACLKVPVGDPLKSRGNKTAIGFLVGLRGWKIRRTRVLDGKVGCRQVTLRIPRSH
jgi:hypothetical protein